jgi:large subunit ribosomal protein L24
MKLKLKRDDTVQIISGKDRGKTGKILKIDSANRKVIVQGLNIVRKAVKQKSQNEKGGIIDVEAALALSNVMIVCKKCGPTKIGFSISDGTKKRICKKCGETL